MQTARWMRVLLGFGLALVAPSLKGNTLGPGSSGAPDAFSLGSSGQLRTVLANLSGQWGDSSVFGGDFIEQVDADPANPFCSGCLDFLFQLENFSGSGETITRFTEDSLLGYRTDVGYDLLSVGGLIMCGIDDGGACNSGDPSTIPNSVDRNFGGEVVGFNFPGVVFVDSTVDLVIMTDATTFTDPLTTVYGSNGHTGTALMLGPSGPAVSGVPEPSSVVLFGSGMVLLTCFLHCRLRRHSSVL